MPICSYLILARSGESGTVAARLERLPRCEAVRADNRDVLLLVTETESPREEEALRETLGSLPGVEALMLTFGDLGGDRGRDRGGDPGRDLGGDLAGDPGGDLGRDLGGDLGGRSGEGARGGPEDGA